MKFLKERQKNRIWQRLAVTLLVVIGVFCGVGGVGAFTQSQADQINANWPELWNWDISSSANNRVTVPMDGPVALPEGMTLTSVGYISNRNYIQVTNPNAVQSAFPGFGTFTDTDGKMYLTAPQGLKFAYNGKDDYNLAPAINSYFDKTTGNLIYTDNTVMPSSAGMPGKDTVTGKTVAPRNLTEENTARSIIGTMIAWVLYYIASGLGAIMVLVAKVMLTVAVFNTFIAQPPVQAGWAILRDLCNNFFIIFMLIMAGGIALRQPGYQLRPMLTKILSSAILINFSLMFVGILIDVSQIVMLTFAGPLANSTGYGLILTAMGLPDAYSMRALMSGADATANTIGTWDVIVALLFAIIVTIISIVVIGTIAVILVYRIVMLMFLAVLSPLPWVARATNISQISSISGEWYSRLGKMLAVGPAMMFFLYLSFLFFATPMTTMDDSMKSVVATQSSTSVSKDKSDDNLLSKQSGVADLNSTTYSNISNMGSVQGLLKFMLTIGFLVGSLMMGQRFGDGAAKYASKAQGWLTKQGKRFSGANLAQSGLNKIAQVPGGIAKKVGQGVGTGALGIASSATRGLGTITNSTGLQKLGDVGTQWRKDVLGARKSAREKKLAAYMGKIGLGSDEAKQKWGEFTDTDLARRTKAVAVGAGSVAATVGTGLALGPMGLGLTAMPFLSSLTAAAAGYLGGGGRLAEMGLGQWGQRRTREKEAEKKRIDDAKSATSQIVTDSETARDANVESRTSAYLNNATYGADRRRRKAANDEAKRRMAEIENSTLTDRNKKNGVGLDPAVLADLARTGWRRGTEITPADLARAVNNVKTGADGTNTWSGFRSDIGSFHGYQVELDRFKNEEENRHRTNVINQLDGRVTAATTPEARTVAETERRRFETEYDARVTLDLNTQRIKADLETELATINASGATELDKIAQRRRAQQTHDEEMTRVNKQHVDEIAPVQHREPRPTAIDDFLADYTPYAHENWVSQSVAKDAKKMQTAIKNLIDAIEKGGSSVLDSFEQLDKGSFYSQSGQSETQYKSIKALNDSTQGITNLIDALSKMPKDLDGAQAQLVKELKQGIAAFRKGGGDTTKLTAVITLLDQKTGKDKDGKVIDDKTVSQYETDIKPKK